MHLRRDGAKGVWGKFAYDRSSQFRAESRRRGLKGPRLALPTQAAGFGSGFSASTAKLCRNIATQLRHDFDAAGVVVSGDELWTWMHNLPIGAAKEARA
ncbi:hypothetical protein MOV61_18925 [Neorhizobium sp. BETTINA12A]|uniref:hypothetical protein n=1 Tax=Neorhizobium sp. BETTINA12A TaxID=2908924 RepID=UPI001FF39938|nr:hypothetical protein [Neorhizobium sp. BETTINA12A]MCJ9752797.1 hypothetical protein [Neorhizobium sp. BETTINA12A]